MRRMLFAFAVPALTAAAISAPPAAAQSFATAGFTSAPAFASVGGGGTTEGIRNATSSLSGVTVHHGDRGDRGDPGVGRDHQRRDRGFGGSYYSDLRDGYDLNRTWTSDSYNDWWHDRPDRAFPRWIGQNQNCERQYWTGGGWRC
ncbi:MAG: hypothetical protein ABIS38_03005 [Sphingomicrobium sp.]